MDKIKEKVVYMAFAPIILALLWFVFSPSTLSTLSSSITTSLSINTTTLSTITTTIPINQSKTNYTSYNSLNNTLSSNGINIVNNTSKFNSNAANITDLKNAKLITCNLNCSLISSISINNTIVNVIEVNETIPYGSDKSLSNYYQAGANNLYYAVERHQAKIQIKNPRTNTTSNQTIPGLLKIYNISVIKNPSSVCINTTIASLGISQPDCSPGIESFPIVASGDHFGTNSSFKQVNVSITIASTLIGDQTVPYNVTINVGGNILYSTTDFNTNSIKRTFNFTYYANQTFNITIDGGGNANYSIDDPSEYPSGALYEQRLNIQNTQSTALVTNTPIELFYPANSFSQYLATNMVNIAIFNGVSGKVIPGWIEGNSVNEDTGNANTPVLSQSGNVIIWLKMPDVIAGSSTDSNYYIAYFKPIGSRTFNQNWGAAPQLFCFWKNKNSNCPATSYSGADNGNNIFSFYDNFTGTSLQGWWQSSAGSVTVNNGLVMVGGVTAADICSTPGCSGNTGSYQWLSPYNSMDALASFNSVLSLREGDTGWQNVNHGTYISTLIGSYDLCTGNLCATTAFLGTGSTTMNQIETISGFSTNFNGLLNYGYSGSNTLTITGTVGGLYADCILTGFTCNIQYIRVRQSWPNDVNPTITMNAILPVFQGYIVYPTNLIVDEGQYVNFNGNVVQGDNPFTYNFLVFNSVTNAQLGNLLVSNQGYSYPYLFNIPIGMGGNSIQANAIFVDSNPTTRNSIITPVSMVTNIISTSGATSTFGVLNPATGNVYIINQNSHSVDEVNTITNSITRTFQIGQNPDDIAITPSNSILYIPEVVSGDVNVISMSTGLSVNSIVIPQVGGGADNPVTITFNTKYTLGYVTVSNTVANNGLVDIFNTVSNVISNIISVGKSPQIPLYDYNNTLLYVTNTNSNTVSVINTTSNTVVNTISVGGQPVSLALDPSGRLLYVSVPGSHAIQIINPTTNSVINTIFVGSTSSDLDMQFDSSGEYIFAANAPFFTRGTINTGGMDIISALTNTVVSRIYNLSNPVTLFSNITNTGVFAMGFNAIGGGNGIIYKIAPYPYITANPVMTTPSISLTNTLISPGQSVLVGSTWTGGSQTYYISLYSSATSTCNSGKTLINTYPYFGVNTPTATFNVMPSVNTWYCIFVTDSASTPVTMNSITAEVQLNTGVTTSNIIATNVPYLDSLQFITFNTVASLGTAPYTYNFSIYNSIGTPISTYSLVANMLTTSNTFTWQVPPLCNQTSTNLPDPKGIHGIFFLGGGNGNGQLITGNFVNPIANYILQDPNLCGMTNLVDWNAIEPTQGVFNWTVTDNLIKYMSGNHLKEAFIFEGVAEPFTANNPTPQWVSSQLGGTCNAVPGSLPCPSSDQQVLCNFATSGQNQNYPVPVYWNTIYQNAWQGFIANVVQKYGSNKNVAYMRFGIGTGGEDDLDQAWTGTNTAYSPSTYCQTFWNNVGYSYGNWITYSNNLVNFMGSLSSNVPLGITLDGSQPNDHNYINSIVMNAITGNIIVGSQSWGYNPSGSGGSPGQGLFTNTCPSINGPFDAFCSYAKGNVPIEIQTSAAISPEPYYPFVLENAIIMGAQILEINGGLWSPGSNPNAVNQLTDGYAYKAAFGYAANTLGMGKYTNIQTNVVVTDSGSSVANSILSNNQVVNVILIAANMFISNSIIEVGQSSTLTANSKGGSLPHHFKWSTSSTCSSFFGGTGINQVVSPTSTTTYYYQVTDNAITPVSQCSFGSVVTVSAAPNTPTLTTPGISSIAELGSIINFAAFESGGTTPYTYNFLVYNSVTNIQVANLITTSNTFSWKVTGAIGNTINANVFVTDNAPIPVTVNSIYTQTITIVAPQSVGLLTVTNTLINQGQYSRLTAGSTSGGIAPYTYNWFNQATCLGSTIGSGTSIIVQPTWTTAYSFNSVDSAGTSVCSVSNVVTVNPASGYPNTTIALFSELHLLNLNNKATQVIPLTQGQANALANNFSVIVAVNGNLNYGALIPGMKATNPNTVILGYVNTIVYGSLTSPYAYATNTNGGVVIFSINIMTGMATSWEMDITNTLWQQYIASQCSAYVANGFDGCFLDYAGTDGLGSGQSKPVNALTNKIYTATQWVQVMDQYSNMIHAVTGNYLIKVMANAAESGNKYFNFTGSNYIGSSASINYAANYWGVQSEQFIRQKQTDGYFFNPEANWSNDINMVYNASQNGYHLAVVTKLFPPVPSEQQNQALNYLWHNFSQASYMLGEGPTTSFQFLTTNEVSLTNVILSNTLYGNVTIGPATGNYYTNNNLYIRNFSDGMVIVAPNSITKSRYYLQLPQIMQTFSGTQITSVNLWPNNGIILRDVPTVTISAPSNNPVTVGQYQSVTASVSMGGTGYTYIFNVVNSVSPNIVTNTFTSPVISSNSYTWTFPILGSDSANSPEIVNVIIIGNGQPVVQTNSIYSSAFTVNEPVVSYLTGIPPNIIYGSNIPISITTNPNLGAPLQLYMTLKGQPQGSPIATGLGSISYNLCSGSNFCPGIGYYTINAFDTDPTGNIFNTYVYIPVNYWNTTNVIGLPSNNIIACTNNWVGGICNGNILYSTSTTLTSMVESFGNVTINPGVTVTTNGYGFILPSSTSNFLNLGAIITGNYQEIGTIPYSYPLSYGGSGASGAAGASTMGNNGVNTITPTLTNANLIRFYNGGLQNYLNGAGSGAGGLNGGGVGQAGGNTLAPGGATVPGSCTGSQGNGANGAYGLLVQANQITPGTITSNGLNGGNGGGATCGGGGGSGAGSIIFAFNGALASTSKVYLNGGIGGTGASSNPGGFGGNGIIISYRYSSIPINYIISGYYPYKFNTTSPSPTISFTVNQIYNNNPSTLQQSVSNINFFPSSNQQAGLYLYNFTEVQGANSVSIYGNLSINMTDVASGFTTFNNPIIQYFPNFANTPLFTITPNAWLILGDNPLNRYTNTITGDQWSDGNITFTPLLSLTYNGFGTFTTNILNNPRLGTITQNPFRLAATNGIAPTGIQRQILALSSFNQRAFNQIFANTTSGLTIKINNYTAVSAAAWAANLFNVYMSNSLYQNPPITISSSSLTSTAGNYFQELNNYCPISLLYGQTNSINTYSADSNTNNASEYTINVYQGAAAAPAGLFLFVNQVSPVNGILTQIESYRIPGTLGFSLPLQSNLLYSFSVSNCNRILYTTPLSTPTQPININIPVNITIPYYPNPKPTISCSTTFNAIANSPQVNCKGYDLLTPATAWKINVYNITSILNTSALLNTTSLNGNSFNWTYLLKRTNTYYHIQIFERVATVNNLYYVFDYYPLSAQQAQTQNSAYGLIVILILGLMTYIGSQDKSTILIFSTMGIFLAVAIGVFFIPTLAFYGIVISVVILLFIFLSDRI